MVNHIRTLLINAPAHAQAPFSDTFVDPQYRPVTPPRLFHDIGRIVLPEDLESRVLLADAVCGVCHAGELAPYMVAFDPRLTYTGRAAATLPDLLRQLPRLSPLTELVQRLAQAPLTGVIGQSVFTWDAQAQAMSDLFKAWTSSTEGVLRVGALMVALAYQLERVRGGGSHG